MIRLGDIQFLNSWPVTYALRCGLVEAPVKVFSAPPAELNRRLLTGELDAGAVSSMLVLRHLEEFTPVPGFCIRSDGGVHSVLVVSRRPLTELKGQSIGVSNQGATTPVLLKILLKRRGLKMRLEPTPLRFPEILEEFPAALLIGDEALNAGQAEDLLSWDLGQAWTDWTKLPAVFALWVVRRPLADRHPELPGSLAQALEASHRWAGSHPKELVAAMRKVCPLEVNALIRYLGALSYELDRRAWVGLKRFAREAEKVGELSKGTARKLIRVSKGWQGLERVSKGKPLLTPAHPSLPLLTPLA